MSDHGDGEQRSLERGSDEELSARVERVFKLRSRLEKTVLWPMTVQELVALHKTIGLVYGPMGRVLPTNEELDILEKYLNM